MLMFGHYLCVIFLGVFRAMRTEGQCGCLQRTPHLRTISIVVLTISIISGSGKKEVLSVGNTSEPTIDFQGT